ncbi:MAG: phasin family protein [Pseudomonadota bacterium]|nr:phasin family protein [Pseudomonadota bacterium]
MAKLKKTARKSTSGTTKDANAQAERLGKSITESAQQIWLAGMGAFNRAQAEGGKLFESLVRDGLSLEQTARKFAGNRAEVVRDVVEGRGDQAKERAADTWDKLESVFEDRVQRALVKLGVPRREDLTKLTTRVEGLTAELRKANNKQPVKTDKVRKSAAKAPRSPRKTAAAPVVKKPVKKARADATKVS